MLGSVEHLGGGAAFDPSAEALASVLRFTLCRDGVEQMRADADEAVRRELGLMDA